MVTKICVGACLGDIYHLAKFCPNRFRGFGPAHAWFRAPRNKVTRLLYLGTWERLPPRRVHRFWRKMRQTTRFRARKCLWGSRNQYLSFGAPFSQKQPFWGPIWTRTVITRNSWTNSLRVFKLGGRVGHVTSHVWQLFKVKRSKVKVTRSRTRNLRIQGV